LLTFYLTHNGVKAPLMQVADSSISGGLPGIEALATTDSFSSWVGGNLSPSRTGVDSIFDPDSAVGIPQKRFVTTSDYTNAGGAGTFTNVLGATQTTIGLAFLVAANTNYTMHCQIVWSASAVTTGPEFQITGPGSPTSVVISMMSAITGATTASAAATAFSTALNPEGATVTSATNEVAYVDMSLVNGANAGTVQLQASPQGAGTLTIRQGSSCTLQ
jgi:hypothetical protein